MNNIDFSDEALPEIEQAVEAWVEPPEFAPPVPAGKYVGHIDQIREEVQKMVEGMGQRYFVTLDIRILGGEHSDRLVTYVRVNNIERDRKRTGTKSSTALDLCKAANITAPLRSNRDFHEALVRMKEMGPAVKFGFQVDWRAFCSSCYGKKLITLTGAETEEAAKNKATDEQKSTASDFATKARNYSKFPSAKNGQGKADTFTCNDCGEEIRAQMNVNRFFRP